MIEFKVGHYSGNCKIFHDIRTPRIAAKTISFGIISSFSLVSSFVLSVPEFTTIYVNMTLILFSLLMTFASFIWGLLPSAKVLQILSRFFANVAVLTRTIWNSYKMHAGRFYSILPILNVYSEFSIAFPLCITFWLIF